MGQCRCECLKLVESEEPPASRHAFSQYDEDVPTRVPAVVHAYPATQTGTEDSGIGSSELRPNTNEQAPDVVGRTDADDENLRQLDYVLEGNKSLGVVFTEFGLPEPNGTLVVKLVARGSPLAKPLIGSTGTRAGDVVVEVNNLRGDKSFLHNCIKSVKGTGGNLRLGLRVRKPIFEVHLVMQGMEESMGFNLAAVEGVPDRIAVRGIASQGAMPVWNEQNPSMNVVSGDWIISINGTRCLAQEMLESIQASWQTFGTCRLEISTDSGQEGS